MDSHKFLDTAPWQKLRDPVQTPAPTVKAAPVQPRDWRTIALVTFGAVFLLILAIGVWRLADAPVRSQSTPAPVVTPMPLAIQYAKPVANTGRTTIVRTTISAHPPILPGRPLIIMPSAPDYATRRQFSERCAACHQPY